MAHEIKIFNTSYQLFSASRIGYSLQVIVIAMSETDVAKNVSHTTMNNVTWCYVDFCLEVNVFRIFRLNVNNSI